MQCNMWKHPVETNNRSSTVYEKEQQLTNCMNMGIAVEHLPSDESLVFDYGFSGYYEEVAMWYFCEQYY